jgi:hypothetical protein
MINELFNSLNPVDKKALILHLNKGTEYRHYFDENKFLGVNVVIPEDQIVIRIGHWTYGNKKVSAE